MTITDCVFCDYKPAPPAELMHEWYDTLLIKPLRPIVPGHRLIVPREHVADAAEDPFITAATMARAAEYAKGRRDDFNLITSAGRAATQTVFHFHVHYVPRQVGDGLLLPWSEP